MERLGAENLPKTFDKFQEMKYTDVKEWNELKTTYREVGWQLEALKNHSIGTTHTPPYNALPNSVFDNYGADGTLLQRRFYGRTGKPRLDLDMTDHGNAKDHPIVPHYHDWYELQDGNVKRSLESDKAPELWHLIANSDILK